MVSIFYFILFFAFFFLETTQMHMKSNVPFRWKLIVKWGNNVLRFELVLLAGTPTGISKWQDGEINALRSTRRRKVVRVELPCFHRNTVWPFEKIKSVLKKYTLVMREDLSPAPLSGGSRTVAHSSLVRSRRCCHPYRSQKL